jgi:hypothetical protein
VSPEQHARQEFEGAGVVTLRLNPAPSRTEGSGTGKFNGVRLGGVEGSATRQQEIQRASFGRPGRVCHPRS